MKLIGSKGESDMPKSILDSRWGIGLRKWNQAVRKTAIYVEPFADDTQAVRVCVYGRLVDLCPSQPVQEVVEMMADQMVKDVEEYAEKHIMGRRYGSAIDEAVRKSHVNYDLNVKLARITLDFQV